MDALHKTTQELEDWLADFHIPESRTAILVNPQYVERDYLGDDRRLPKEDRYWEIGIHARDRRDLDRYADSTTRFDTTLNYYDGTAQEFWQLYNEVVRELDFAFPDAELYHVDTDY